MAAKIPGYADAQQATEPLELAAGTVFSLNSSRADFPAAAHVGRTPLWPVDRLDAWRDVHPKRGD